MGASLRVPLAYAPDWPSALATYLAPSEAGAAGGAVWLHAADARAAATPYFDVAWADGGRHALVVGAEAAGLSPWVRAAAEASAEAAAAEASAGSRRNGGAEVRVDFVSIPLAAAPHSLAAHAAGAGSSPAVESLNAAVAGSIVLCEAHRQIIASDRRAKSI
jgi:tRNA G18 (ribose-2'-O)-methylase SpoU